MLILITLIANLYANPIEEIRLSKETHFITGDRDKSNNRWSPYLSDYCETIDANVENEIELREKGMRRCSDSSISFVQPASQGAGGWEGKCGQTAAANVVFHHCKKAFNPQKDLNKYFSDLTPGVHPNKLTKGLNKIFKEHCSSSKKWSRKHFKKSIDYINFINSKIAQGPVITLIKNFDSKELHWVTIVEKARYNQSCHYLVNHWDNQYSISCLKLAKMSNAVGGSYPIILKRHTLIHSN